MLRTIAPNYNMTVYYSSLTVRSCKIRHSLRVDRYNRYSLYRLPKAFPWQRESPVFQFIAHITQLSGTIESGYRSDRRSQLLQAEPKGP